jgi:hypothetical protein
VVGEAIDCDGEFREQLGAVFPTHGCIMPIERVAQMEARADHRSLLVGVLDRHGDPGPKLYGQSLERRMRSAVSPLALPPPPMVSVSALRG